MHHAADASIHNMVKWITDGTFELRVYHLQLDSGNMTVLQGHRAVTAHFHAIGHCNSCKLRF